MCVGMEGVLTVRLMGADAVPPIDVLDPVAVKRTVDDCLGKLATLAGYQEDLRMSNMKLCIMAVACAVACYAQLGPHTVSFGGGRESARVIANSPNCVGVVSREQDNIGVFCWNVCVCLLSSASDIYLVRQRLCRSNA